MADAILAVACQDFLRITGQMPLEAQVYQQWVYSLAYSRVSHAPLRGQRLIKLAIQQFPGVRTADRGQQKRLGRELLNRLEADPTLQAKFGCDVHAAISQRG